MKRAPWLPYAAFAAVAVVGAWLELPMDATFALALIAFVVGIWWTGRRA